jgi:hypothetical protein
MPSVSAGRCAGCVLFAHAHDYEDEDEDEDEDGR